MRSSKRIPPVPVWPEVSAWDDVFDLVFTWSHRYPSFNSLFLEFRKQLTLDQIIYLCDELIRRVNVPLTLFKDEIRTWSEIRSFLIGLDGDEARVEALVDVSSGQQTFIYLLLMRIVSMSADGEPPSDDILYISLVEAIALKRCA